MIIPALFFLVVLVWIGLVVGIGIVSWRFSKSKKVTGVAVVLAFLVMYWPAFGDYFPTVNAHKEYCEKEAGFKIHMTPEQWIAENPGVLETLMPYEKFTPYDQGELGNERFAIKFDMFLIEGVAVRKEVSTFVDIKTKKILYESVNFSRGYRYYEPQDWRNIKIWLNFSSCYSYKDTLEKNSKKDVFFKKLNTKWSVDK